VCGIDLIDRLILALSRPWIEENREAFSVEHNDSRGYKIDIAVHIGIDEIGVASDWTHAQVALERLSSIGSRQKR